MKKVLSVLLMLAMLATVLPMSILAEDAEVQTVSDDTAFDALSAEMETVMLPCLMEKIQAGVSAEQLLDTLTYRAEIIACLDALEAYAAEHSEKQSAFEAVQTAYWDCLARLMEAVLNGDAINTILNDPQLYAYYGAELEQTLGWMEENTFYDSTTYIGFDILSNIYDNIQATYAQLRNHDIGNTYYTQEELEQAKEACSTAKNPQQAFKDWKTEKKHACYKKYRNVAAGLLDAGMGVLEQLYAVKGYDSFLQASLNGTEYTEDALYSVLNAVQNHAYLMERSTEIWKKVANLDTITILHYSHPNISEESYEELYQNLYQNLIEAVLEPFGEEYLSIIRQAYEEDRIHIKEANVSYDTMANYYMPFKNEIYFSTDSNSYDVHTLIHELGHLVNFAFFENSGNTYTHFNQIVGEVASQVNQILFWRYMVNNAENDADRMQYLLSDLYEIETFAFYQSMLADFEVSLHELVLSDVSVTADMLDELYREKHAAYFPYYTMLENEESEWINIAFGLLDTPDAYYHMRYSMSFGMAVLIADGILAGDEEMLNKYMDFLRNSFAEPTADLFLEFGIDLNSENCMDAVFAHYESVMDEIDALYEKMNAQ